MNELTFDSHMRWLRPLAQATKEAREEHDERYFKKRNVGPDRNFFIVCRHWNSNTPILPTSRLEVLPYPTAAGYGFGGGYFLVANGMGDCHRPGIRLRSTPLSVLWLHHLRY